MIYFVMNRRRIREHIQAERPMEIVVGLAVSPFRYMTYVREDSGHSGPIYE